MAQGFSGIFKNADKAIMLKYLPSFKSIKVESKGEGTELSELRRRVLEREKANYWEQFNKGIINSETVIK